MKGNRRPHQQGNHDNVSIPHHASALDQSSLNLRILQRHDPEATTILSIGNHVSLFLFQSDSWIKSDVEGCVYFYVCQANISELRLFILNRQSTLNYTLKIGNPLQRLQFEKNFMIIEESSGPLGLWFYDEKEYFRVKESLVATLNQLGHQNSNNGNAKNISNLLREAVQKRRFPSMASPASSTLDVVFSGLSGRRFRSLDEFQNALLCSLQNDRGKLVTLFDLYQKYSSTEKNAI